MPGVTLNGLKSPQAESSYAEEGQRWAANTYGILLRDKARWQRVSMGLLVLTLAFGSVMAWMAGWGTRVQAYVVHLDAQGVEHVIRPVPALPIKPEQNIVRTVLIQWIEKARALSSDRLILAQNMEWLKDHTTTAMYQQLNEMRQEQDERQRVAHTRVQVLVKSVLPVGGASQSWAIEWEERAYTPEGRVLARETLAWKATLRVADFQDKAAKQQMRIMRDTNNYRNILGIFVSDVAFATPTPLL